MEEHLKRLAKMYHKAPINLLMNARLKVLPSKAIIRMKAEPNYFHAGNSLHGSIYFKMLDDASFFAGQSIVSDYFLVTSN